MSNLVFLLWRDEGFMAGKAFLSQNAVQFSFLRKNTFWWHLDLQNFPGIGSLSSSCNESNFVKIKLSLSFVLVVLTSLLSFAIFKIEHLGLLSLGE